MKKNKRLILMLALCGVFFVFASVMAQPAEETRIEPGTMLHAQQVLERYGIDQEPRLQYLELWMDEASLIQREVDEDGQILSYAYSSEDGHLVWEGDTLKTEDTQVIRLFMLDYLSLKSGFEKETTVTGQTYAARPCTLVLLENPSDQDGWVKVYLDDETGFVLFCEAPLFRLRTALFEILPESADTA